MHVLQINKWMISEHGWMRRTSSGLQIKGILVLPAYTLELYTRRNSISEDGKGTPMHSPATLLDCGQRLEIVNHGSGHCILGIGASNSVSF